MATRLYLPSSGTAAISPGYAAAWEDTTIAARLPCDTAKTSTAMTTVAFGDTSTADRDVLFRQYVSPELTANQTVTGAQSLKAQMLVLQDDPDNNMFLAILIKIVDSSGVAQKTLLSVTRDNVEAAAVLTNRQFTATSAAVNYTTVAGDRIVVELGMGGDPALIGATGHDSSIRIGDVAAADLAEDDTTTTDNNPWVELTDTLTFVSAGGDGTDFPWEQTQAPVQAPIAVIAI